MAVMLATRADVLWIAACCLIIGGLVVWGSEALERKHKRAIARQALERRLYEIERSGRGWE